MKNVTYRTLLPKVFNLNVIKGLDINSSLQQVQRQETDYIMKNQTENQTNLECESLNKKPTGEHHGTGEEKGTGS